MRGWDYHRSDDFNEFVVVLMGQREYDVTFSNSWLTWGLVSGGAVGVEWPPTGRRGGPSEARGLGTCIGWGVDLRDGGR